MTAEFKHYDLRIVTPDFDSSLTDIIIELEHLRKKQLGGSAHPQIFFQLKDIFHLLESIGSARIEGNNTTIAEYIETKIDPNIRNDEDIIEIANMEKAMNFIEDVIDAHPEIDRAIILEIHKIIVDFTAVKTTTVRGT